MRNIALACQKMGKFEDMRKACDEVLEKVNPESAKAMYRRAQARIGPASAVESDRQAAIQEGGGLTSPVLSHLKVFV